MASKLVFKTIRWKNMLSTGNMWTEVQLDRSPSTIVTGKNGAGKSTLMDAFYFALFGKAFRKVNKPQLINTRNNRDMLVELSFDVQNDSYLIQRGQKPDIFRVEKNGIQMNMNGDSRLFQREFESKVLRMNYDVASQIIAIGKAQHVSFMRLDPAKRRIFVENILGLIVFGKMSQIHSINVNKHKEKLTELRSAVSVTSEKIKIRKRYIQDLQDNEEESKRNRLQKSQEHIKELKSEIEDFEDQVKDIQSRVPEVSDVSKLKKKLQSLHTDKTMLEVGARDIRKHAEHFKNNDFCDSCGQSIPESLREEKSRTELKKAEGMESRLSEIEEEIKVLCVVIDKETEKLKQRDEMNASISHLERTIDDRGRQIFNLKNESKTTTSGIQKQIKEARKELESLAGLNAALSKKYEDELKRSDYMSLVTSMLKDNGVKSTLIKRFLPIINHSINTNLANLGFFVKFTLDEMFNETIQARGIDTLNYNNFSEGEKLRIDMAIMMAWRDLAKMHGGIATNLLFFDEIFDSSMDLAGMDSLMMLLGAMPETNLFIITHTPDKLADKVRSRIQFEKEKGFSKIAAPTS